MVSNFLAPAYLLYGIGMDYKPNDNFSLYISPLTVKTTIVNDQDLADAGAYGVNPAEFDETTGEIIKDGENFRHELGGYVKAEYRKKSHGKY